MNLGEITYAEFSLLRDLVRAKRMDIWKREWAPRLRKGATVEEANKLFQDTMGKEMTITDRGCCAMLLRRIDEEEKKVQKILERRASRNKSHRLRKIADKIMNCFTGEVKNNAANAKVQEKG